MAVLATLTVGFQSADDVADADGALRLIIDDRPGGLNNGVTTFRPGDPAHILRFKGNNITITSQGTTSGSLSSAGSGLYLVEEILTFADTREANLPFPYTSGLSTEWLGASLGSVSVLNQTTLRVASQGFGLLRVSYNAAYQAFRLSGVPTQYEAALVWAKGDVV